MSATAQLPRVHPPRQAMPAGPDAAGWLPVMRRSAPPARWRGRARMALAAALVVVPAVGTGVMLWQAGELARSHDGRVVPGVVVDGVDLGGMTLEAAATRLHRQAGRWLDRPVELVVGDQRRTVTAGELGAGVDVDRVMERVMIAGRQLTVLDWVDIRWRGGDAGVTGTLTATPVPQAVVEDLLAELAEAVARPVGDAAMSYDDEAITFTPEQDGWALDVEAALPLVTAALAPEADPVERLELPLVTTPAATTLAEMDQVLYLDQSEHALQLWDAGTLVGEWTVATGARGFGTPTGEYAVGEKRENPTWGNPAPDGWGRHMPAFIGPGPANPLGVRAINWEGTAHIRFHGTADEASLGTDASHGCVRLSNDDVVELFDLVQPGALIISVA